MGWHQSLSSNFCSGYVHLSNALFTIVISCTVLVSAFITAPAGGASACLCSMSTGVMHNVMYECAGMAGNSHAKCKPCDSFRSKLSIIAILSTWTTTNPLYMKVQHFKVM